jgi:serine/threonine protein phosphatase PrpC
MYKRRQQMRRINSEFKTANMSEEGHKLSNRDYFGYVEMDDYACYVLADSLDEEPSVNSAKLVVESLIRSFTERPTIGKGKLKSYLAQAHKELTRQHGGMHLKASVVVAVTDYRKIRYGYAGNSRFYLIRNARILGRSVDQSLTQNLLEEHKIPLDQAARHEARNNLYSYLGERGIPKIEISKKMRLENGDIFAVLSRGVWERCSDQELLGFTNDAKEPQAVLDQVEDLILNNQEHNSIDNYTLSVTFVDKVYQSPKKKWTVKRILMVVLPVLLIVGGISLVLYLRHRSIRTKQENLVQYMESGESYLRYDNYQKAAEEYGEALKLAKSLKRQEDTQEADQYKKLAEQIILSDEAMKAGEYQKAQALYLTARYMSVEAGNVGKRYIDAQLKTTKDYIDVFDLIELGEKKEANGNIEGAIKAYKEARDKAASLYYGAGKEEALAKQAAAEEKLDQEEQQEKIQKKEIEESAAAEAAKQQQEKESKKELENQQKANDQQNAIELENKGNELLAEGKYENAITFYQTAQAIYVRLELPELADGINGKIAAARAGIEAEKQAEEEVQRLAREQGTTAAETAEYGPGASVQ